MRSKKYTEAVAKQSHSMKSRHSSGKKSARKTCGRQFEHFVKWFLTNDPERTTRVDEVWLTAAAGLAPRHPTVGFSAGGVYALFARFLFAGLAIVTYPAHISVINSWWRLLSALQAEGSVVVFQHLGTHITEAYQHALDAEHQAAAASTSAIRQEYESLARSWRTVAKSLEFVGTLERFVTDSQRAKDAKPPEIPSLW
jgi:hypothetical protein